MPDCGSATDTVLTLTSAGGLRTRRAVGIMRRAATAATISSVVRQLSAETSHAARGAMVIGAMPMPAETSDTARLRCVSNQPVTQAIIGTMIAAALAPTRSPKTSWNARRDVAWDARARLTARLIAPVMTIARGPNRSERLPQAMLPNAMARKPMVMALDPPVTDQPVSLAIGCSRTGRENIDPIATQPKRPPAATITHRQRDSVIPYRTNWSVFPSRAIQTKQWRRPERRRDARKGRQFSPTRVALPRSNR